MADHIYYIVTSPGNLSKGGCQNTGNGERARQTLWSINFQTKEKLGKAGNLSFSVRHSENYLLAHSVRFHRLFTVSRRILIVFLVL